MEMFLSFASWLVVDVIPEVIEQFDVLVIVPEVALKTAALVQYLE